MSKPNRIPSASVQEALPPIYLKIHHASIFPFRLDPRSSFVLHLLHHSDRSACRTINPAREIHEEREIMEFNTAEASLGVLSTCTSRRLSSALPVHRLPCRWSLATFAAALKNTCPTTSPVPWVLDTRRDKCRH